MASWLQARLREVICVIAVLASASTALTQSANTADITVFAAASLKTGLDAAAADFATATGKKATVSYAASSTLAKQIEQGAPADIFISADIDWMDYLAGKGLIKPETRSNILGNHLVLVAPAASKVVLKLAPNVDLAGALGDGRLAMADVKAVPAGKYGKAALETLGVWTAIEPKIAQAENVRAALALVAREEAPLGIVYQTDAAAEPKVRIVDTFAGDTHPPIVYPVAATAAAKDMAAAGDFITFLKSVPAQSHFSKEGFTILK
jgi:molybdate transport system substrate-binding protein